MRREAVKSYIVRYILVRLCGVADLSHCLLLSGLVSTGQLHAALQLELDIQAHARRVVRLGSEMMQHIPMEICGATQAV